jgi:hypothetical protein
VASTVPARGGPWWTAKDGKHTIGPSKPGAYVLGAGSPVVTSWWAFSQLAWGTPLREVTPSGGRIDVKYGLGGEWKSTRKLAVPITRQEIIDAEVEYGRPAAVPSAWDLNDFGKRGYAVGGTDMLVHTTPETEDAPASMEKLGFSHGCIHVRPVDREALEGMKLLKGGIRVVIRAYAGKSTPTGNYELTP